MHEFLDIAPEVADALAAGRPVVALESTVLAHGLPYPRNLDTAAAMRAGVRDESAVPAIIGVIDGRVRIGLTDDELEILATGADVLKLSRRDLAYAIATARHGGTTVAGTMFCARLAGIAIFATGGLGGVHRGHEETLDVSADLNELAATPVAVVCAGAKAILDLPRTLEYLETAGVPVIGYRTDDFPAFYMRDSGLSVPCRADTPDDIARIARTHWALGATSGLVIAQPAPADTALPRDEVEAAIDRALRDAAAERIGGKRLTPFLLDRIADITGGRSVEANAALIENNARLAGRIAACYASLMKAEAARRP